MLRKFHFFWVAVWRALLSKRVQNVVITAEIVALIFITVASILVRQPSELKTATTHQPERLTELYFPYSSNLPATYKPNQTIVLTFAVHNLEARNMTYPFQISFVSSSVTDIVDKDDIAIGNGQTAIVALPVTVSTTAERVAVTVELLNNHETIHLWLRKV